VVSEKGLLRPFGEFSVCFRKKKRGSLEEGNHIIYAKFGKSRTERREKTTFQRGLERRSTAAEIQKSKIRDRKRRFTVEESLH